MKKLLALALALALLLGTVGALAETTLKLGIWPVDTDERGLETHETVFLPAFLADHPDVIVEKAPYDYNLQTILPLLESGNAPHVLSTWFTEPAKLVPNNFVVEITDALAAKGWLDKLAPSIRSAVSYGGSEHVYGVPRNFYGLGLMLNAELFEEAGLVDEAGLPLYPKTWDELIDVSVKIKEETGAAGLCLLAADNAGGWHFVNIAWTFGANFESLVDGKWVANVNSPEAVAALQLVKDMKWKYDILTADPTAENWGTGFQHLGVGSAAMYIAADDAVAQPTANYGLPKEKLMMIGIPAGPAGSYTLVGGNLFMFPSGTDEDQINAALDYIEVMGYAPIVTESARQGRIGDYESNVANGVPVMRGMTMWIDEDYNAMLDELYEQYVNVDPAMFQPYYESIAAEGALKGEEPQQTQDLYAELTKALQEILTNENADPQAVLDIAQANFQSLLDEQVNK
ncbi:sugar ABC transporter substrate-binding protein [Clostridia bacterium]|nr:sugar ABC transporter substrate-binding protein [Clostridia bacterium]